MSIYAIGSVNGHYRPLLDLLEKIRFNPDNDCLWFAGDLVNKGPDSLAVLRFVKSLGKQAVTVLGDQELHLLTLAAGLGQAEAGDTLDEILAAPDRDELLKWLRRRPLIHHDSKLNFTLVHAGIPGEWTFSQALTFAYEVESVLASGNYATLLANQGQDQSRWHPKLTGWKRLRFIINAYTLMAYCNSQGKLAFNAGGAPTAPAEDWQPWYRSPGRMTAHLNIVFANDGHFNDDAFPGIYPLSGQDGLLALKLC